MTGIAFDNLEITQVYGGFPEDESLTEILDVCISHTSAGTRSNTVISVHLGQG